MLGFELFDLLGNLVKESGQLVRFVVANLIDQSVFPARPVEVSREGVMLAGLQLGQELSGALLNFDEFRNERLTVHIVIFHDMNGFASNS